MVALIGCGGEGEAAESSREGCGDPGSHSEPIGKYSCACEPGYEWCDEARDSFECCVDDSATTDEGGAPEPDAACDEALAESLLCVPDPSGDPGASLMWACNGERWVEIAGYARFACMAEGLEFAYGCTPGPAFLCGYGPGSPCESEGYAGICVDEEIIDTCVWGRRTVDRCARLCGELQAFGPGFTGGACEDPVEGEPALCVCS
ncbi:hypothetical protein DB30_03707 [Enhygromyxa salina]|uniref:Uncharacterized protein n=1 Tax=Enhygromyxa salina TaxID=215803 RepID=A0A0C2D618_9BACT|nr:hypothetical protein [Enhygromyxa salina]KIG17110.1 hypothetical protein DB30_03707 [Enhygromyxa salina]